MRSRLQRDLSFWADFNVTDAEHRVATSLRFADEAAIPRAGEVVWLHDDEGNAVRGVVDEVAGMVVYVRPEMSTWTAEAALPRFQGSEMSFAHREPQVSQLPARE